MFNVILAGGSGTRFWPKSRELFPKQLIRIVGSKTMVQATAERLLALSPVENLFLVTNESHALETCRQLVPFGFHSENLIAEPVARNTAAAIGLAARVLAESDPQEVMGIYPADHIINNTEVFERTVKKAVEVARQGYLVTLGAQPHRPETGYGYIKQGLPLSGFDQVFMAERFTEKPDLISAQRFVDDGNYFWNCGVFFWKVSTILEHIRQLLPDLFEHLDNLYFHLVAQKGRYPFRLLDPEGAGIFERLPNESVDFGIMEKAEKVAMIPCSMEWNDVGSWTTLEDLYEKDENGNVFSSNVVSLNSKGSIIQGEGRLIATVGIENMIIVDTPDALLICDKNQAQDVKKIVETIKKEGKPQATLHPTVHKPWGSYTVLEAGTEHLVKRIDVNPGEMLSLQSHEHRSENWTVLSGTARVQKDKEILNLNKSESIFIPKGSKHRISNPGDSVLSILEVQLGDILKEEDIIRYEDAYGRPVKNSS